MDKLPCSTSFLMSINFEGLKEVIDFFHKNINILNEKFNDLNKKFKGFEDLQNQMNENKIKTESGLRLLGELEQSINNYSQNIMQNTQNIMTNKENLSLLKEELEKIKLDNENKLNNVKKLYSNQNQNGNVEKEINSGDNYTEFKSEIEKIKIENKENFDKLFDKVEELEFKINKNNEKNKDKDENKININNEVINNNINNNENEVIENSSILYKDLCNKVNLLEEKINKITEEKTEEIIPPERKELEIKNGPLSKSENKINKISEIPENNNNINETYDDKLNKIENKITYLESIIVSLQLKKDNNNENQIQYSSPIENSNANIFGNNTNEIIIHSKNLTSEESKQKEKEEDKEKKEELNEIKDNNENFEEIKNMINENKNQIKLNESKIIEISSQINEINKTFSQGKFEEKAEFLKYSKTIEIQLKDYNEKINKLLSKESFDKELLNKINRSNNVPRSFEKTEDKKTIKYKETNSNNKELLESIEETFHSMIQGYLQKLDISQNPKILELENELSNQINLINDLTSKSIEISIENNNQNKNCLNLIENTKSELEKNIKKIENQLLSFPILKEELEFCEGILFGKEEGEKYKKMSKEERRNELSIGTSVKEEINIHGNYLKKLSEGINKVNNRINNLNKENLALIKKDLKNESNFILEDFKSGLKESISKIEDQLRDKVDKLGLDQFWNKINDQLIEEMKQKIDKKELNKNNMYLKKKIDNLESKISRTFVDTLIDLQMDEAPLLVKKNFREITEQKCASCGQNLQGDKNINNGLLGTSLDFNNIGINQHKTYRQRNISDKDKLPEIKTNLQNK